VSNPARTKPGFELIGDLQPVEGLAHPLQSAAWLLALRQSSEQGCGRRAGPGSGIFAVEDPSAGWCMLITAPGLRSSWSAAGFRAIPQHAAVSGWRSQASPREAWNLQGQIPISRGLSAGPKAIGESLRRRCGDRRKPSSSTTELVETARWRPAWGSARRRNIWRGVIQRRWGPLLSKSRAARCAATTEAASFRPQRAVALAPSSKLYILLAHHIGAGARCAGDQLVAINSRGVCGFRRGPARWKLAAGRGLNLPGQIAVCSAAGRSRPEGSAACPTPETQHWRPVLGDQPAPAGSWLGGGLRPRRRQRNRRSCASKARRRMVGSQPSSLLGQGDPGWRWRGVVLVARAAG